MPSSDPLPYLFIAESSQLPWRSAEPAGAGLFDVVSSASGLAELIEQQAYLSYGIIGIALSVSWYDSPTPLAGLEITKELRQRGCANPIVLYGSLTKEEVRALPRNHYPYLQVLTTPGHYYLPLDRHFLSQLTQLPSRPLSPFLIKDIQYHIFPLAGQIDHILHGLKNLRRAGEIAASVNKAFDQLGQLPSANTVALRQIAVELTAHLQDTDDPYDYLAVIDQYKDRITACVPLDVHTPGPGSPAPWSVLCIDDNPRDLDRLAKLLQPICHRVYLVTNWEDAAKKLRQDQYARLENTSNLPIRVVISDLRLEDKQGNWQVAQGWDILHTVQSTYPGRYALFLVSAKRSSLLMQTGEQQLLRIFAYPKSMVLQTDNPYTEWFIAHVRQEGDLLHQRRLDRPDTKVWREKFEPYYAHYQGLNSHKQQEAIINREALHFVEQVAAIYLQERSVGPDNRIGNKSYQLRAGINQTVEPDKPEKLDMFYQKLTIRRIILGLHLWGKLIGKHEMPLDDICSYLKFGFVNEKEDRSIHVRTELNGVALVTALDDIIEKREILREERNFLAYHLRVAPDRADRSFYNAIRNICLPYHEEGTHGFRMAVPEQLRQQLTSLWHKIDSINQRQLLSRLLAYSRLDSVQTSPIAATLMAWLKDRESTF